MTQLLQVSLSGAPLAAVAVAFLGGILVSLTPCVYPVIPLTVAYIGAGGAGATRTRSFTLALVYVLGLAMTYAALGVVSALANRVFGTLAGSPAVLLIVGGFFLVFGLAMMDVIPLPLPAALANINPGRRAGFAGAFLVGVISGLVAMPCSTPVLLAILTHIAQHGGVFYGFSLMFAYALGFGILLIVVGTSAGALTSLPKSGVWMVWIKRVAGLVIIGMGGWYLFTGARGLNRGTAPAHAAESFITAQGPGAITERIGKQPLFLVFYGSWCKVCAEEVPELNKLYNTYKDTRLAFYGVDINDTREKATEFINKHHVEYPVIWDATQSKIAERFEILSTPTIIIYDAAGKHLYFGADPPQELHKFIKTALASGADRKAGAPNAGEPPHAKSPDGILEITIIGDKDHPAFQPLVDAAENFAEPSKVIVLFDPEADAARIAQTPYRAQDVPTLFACIVGEACARPIMDPARVEPVLRLFVKKFLYKDKAAPPAGAPAPGQLAPAIR